MLRFLTTYSLSVKLIPGVERLGDALINVLALALSTGESFLPDAKSYDDLFYQVLQSGEHLNSFKTNFELSKTPTSTNIDLLLNVSRHYIVMLEEKTGKGNKDVSPREVREIIKQGYETLSIQARDDLDHWEKYREADHRNLLKRIARMAVQDSKMLLADFR